MGVSLGQAGGLGVDLALTLGHLCLSLPKIHVVIQF